MPPSRRNPRHGRRQEAVYWAPSSTVAAAASRGDVNERVSTSLVRIVSPPRDLQQRSTAFTYTNSMNSNSSSSFLPTANSSSTAAPNRTKNSSGVLALADCRRWDEGQRFVSFPSSFSETSRLLSMSPLPRSAPPSCSYSSTHRIIQILDEVLDILLDQEED